ALVKVGFAGVANHCHVAALIRAAVRGASSAGGGVVAVAYADAAAPSVPPASLINIAAGAGARGLLLDTCNKSGPGLCELVDPAALAALVAGAHDAGLFVALAGRLTPHDLTLVRGAGADVAGVRGPACEGGRTGP